MKVIKEELKVSEKALKNNPVIPFESGYCSELDMSAGLSPKEANTFQNLIGILRWTVELGYINILFEGTSLSRFLMQPGVHDIQISKITY